ncbi:MAG TPA: UvrD-helicase domain-containing protein [Steroidobacteraceae bacterium]|nr:UvrD-helicase domain-containing protein [Steroidobacteraceae bacterium]
MVSGCGPSSTSEAAASCDAEARECALDPHLSIALEAPAGSGKTSVLVQRFLRLLATVDEPEEVLAITFTRKAAGEMRERLLQALRSSDPPDPPALDESQGRSQHEARIRDLARAAQERSSRLGWDLRTNPGRLRIQTIDALNRSLAARLPLAARAIGQSEIIDRPRTLFEAAARRALVDAETDAALQADTGLLFARLDNDFGRFERLLTQMLEARAHWLPRLLQDADLCGRVEESLRAIVRARLSEAQALIPSGLLEAGAQLAAAAASHRERGEHRNAGSWEIGTGFVETHQLTLPQWQALARLALTREGHWRKVFTTREGFPADDQPLRERMAHWLSHLSSVRGARELLLELARLPHPELRPEDARALSALSRVLRLAASELEVLFRETGRADHTAVAAAARQALMVEGAPTDLALRLGADLRHILVDEFQDTSLEQVRLLEALTAMWEEGDGRTLFVVGDPMQSIYQFREAEVGLFLRASTHGLGGRRLRPLALAQNFRSAPELVAWANRVFPRCFPQVDDARASAVRYRPSIPARTDAREGVVRWHASAASDPRAEAQAIVDLVRRLQSDDARASIAILLTARSHAPPIVAALGAASIAVTGVDLVALAELPVVRDLQALARALHHLEDRTAWLAVLRAPWCGLTLSELGVLSEPLPQRCVWDAMSDELTVVRLPPAARARLTRTRSALEQALMQRDRSKPARWVEATWHRLGGPAACASDADLDHARSFFEHLARWSEEPDWTGPLSLEGRLEELYASHEPAAGAVQIMTIHRAKGLEFDHVLLPGLGRKLRPSAEPLLRWLELPREEEGSDLLLAPIAALGRQTDHTLGEYLKSLQARRAAHERVRLLYVAATRARYELHLFGDLPLTRGAHAGAPAPAAPRAGTLLAALWPAVGAEFPRAEDPAPPAAGAIVAADSLAGGAIAHSRRTALIRLTADWQLPELPDGPLIDVRTVFSGERENLDVEASLGARTLSLLPEIPAERSICDELRRCARRGSLPRPGSPTTAAALRERLVRLGLAGAELEEEVLRATTLWERCLADAQLQWIFSTEHRGPRAGYRLSGVDAGRIETLTIDRMFVDAHEVRWLVNFRPALADQPGGSTACGAGHAELEMQRALRLGTALAGAQRVRAGVYVPSMQILQEVSTR